MATPINVNDSIELVPSGYDSSNSSYSSISSSYPVTNGYTNASSTSYAYITCNTGSRAKTYISYTFNTSAIPSEATIDSISCSAKVRVSSTSYISTGVTQLYSGSTAKGSATTTRSTSATAYTLTPGTWTRSELDNIQVRFTGTRGTSSTTRAAYLFFYGATLIINYSISGMQYTVTATSSVDGVTATPATQNAMEGNTATVRIDGISLDDVVVKDNDTDITEELVQYAIETGGTLNEAPSSYTVSGSVSGTRYQSTVGHTVENPSTQSGNDYCGSSGSTATIYYKFDFSEIPDNATISSMTVRAHGHLESTSNSSEVASLNTYSGTTEKGTEVSYTSTSSQTVTISPGTWTVAELKDDPRVGFTIGYYGGLTTGITWTVVYSVPSSGGDYYWTYTIGSISADHVITIEEAGAFIPPDEDPTYNYYPITISSINATTDPRTGTVRVQEGTNETIEIVPSDPKLTLALDNGVDITSQLQGRAPDNTFTVAKASGASYGFDLNSSTGYYVSTNDGVSSSASVARVTFNLETKCLATFTYINSGEVDYDYGMFGKLDTTVATDGLTASDSGSSPSDSASNYQLICSSSAYHSQTATHTLTYEIEAGTHYVDVKYGKDQASNSGNDSLQFKVALESLTGSDYTYTLNNINQKHSLIFVFGDVDYYFITSSGTGAKLYPDGQTVKLAGQSYGITIVPDSTTANVTVTDNGTDVTSALVRTEGQSKTGATIVNYDYSISNIQAAHTINVVCGSVSQVIYLKIGETWRACNSVYKKVNGSWVKQSNLANIFNTNSNYVKGN